MGEQASLDDLLVSEDQLNEAALTNIVAPYAEIGKETGVFVPTTKFDELSSDLQTAIVLLYQKAAHALNFEENEGLTPMEISEISGLNHSTVKGAVRRLANKNIVVNDEGTYSVPAYSYNKIEEMISGEEDDD